MVDYKHIYTIAFNDPNYSSDHHIQYDEAINYLVENTNTNSSVIDIGSGRGHFLKLAMIYTDCKLTSYDLDKFHNYDVKFIKGDLSKKDDRSVLESKKYDFVICTDVFEHLDESFIEDVIKTISIISNNAFIAIANHSDIHHGVELHTIQKDVNWWNELISKYFIINSVDIKYNNQLFLYKLVIK